MWLPPEVREVMFLMVGIRVGRFWIFGSVFAWMVFEKPMGPSDPW
jgi:hypothetical protein